MAKLLKILQAAGLATRDEPAEEVASDDLLASVTPAAPITPSTDVLPAEECHIDEARTFDAVYTEEGVPASAYPAEKLLKVLGGLAALDPPMRKTAVAAMDAADDEWSIEDPIRDAAAKMAALNAAKARLIQKARSIDIHGQERIAELQRKQQQAADGIREQIRKLETLLQSEIEKAAQESAQIQAEIRASADASVREGRRMDAEIAKLQELVAMFAPAGAVGGQSSN